MIIRFDDKIVAVTGAGYGFRRQISRTFADHSARVFATDLGEDGLAKTAAAAGLRRERSICGIARPVRHESGRSRPRPAGPSISW